MWRCCIHEYYEISKLWKVCNNVRSRVLQEHKLQRWTRYEVIVLVQKKKTNDGWTPWIVWRNEWTIAFFNKPEKDDLLLPNKEIFQTSLKKLSFSFWINDFFKQTLATKIGFLLNEMFCWTILQWEKERNRWKMNDNFEREQNKRMFNQRNEKKKLNALISTWERFNTHDKGCHKRLLN